MMGNNRFWWGCLIVGASCVSPTRAVLAQGQGPANVVVVEIVQRPVAAGQAFVGQVLPARRSVVGSAVDGRVVSLFVNDGDRVSFVEEGNPPRRTGQPIAQLLTETISIEVAAAQATEELRRQELAELEAGTRPEEKLQTKAKLEAAKALQKFTQSQFERVKELTEKGGAASEEEFEEAVSNMVNAAQNAVAAQAAYDMAERGPRIEQIAQAQARLAAAHQDVRRLEDQQRKYTIRAPFAGYVVTKMTEVGAWVSRGDPVAEVIELDPVEIDVAVPQEFISYVHLGASANVLIQALPADSLKQLDATVARIVPQADLHSRSFPVKIRMNNPGTPDGHLVKSGMLARVTLAVGPKQEALLVPKDALVLGGPTPGVMVADTDPKTKQAVARFVPVQLGVAEGALIQVIGDLQAGQQVITVGNERVRPGQPIAVQSRQAAT